MDKIFDNHKNWIEREIVHPPGEQVAVCPEFIREDKKTRSPIFFFGVLRPGSLAVSITLWRWCGVNRLENKVTAFKKN